MARRATNYRLRISARLRCCRCGVGIGVDVVGCKPALPSSVGICHARAWSKASQRRGCRSLGHRLACVTMSCMARHPGQCYRRGRTPRRPTGRSSSRHASIGRTASTSSTMGTPHTRAPHARAPGHSGACPQHSTLAALASTHGTRRLPARLLTRSSRKPAPLALVDPLDARPVPRRIAGPCAVRAADDVAMGAHGVAGPMTSPQPKRLLQPMGVARRGLLGRRSRCGRWSERERNRERERGAAAQEPCLPDLEFWSKLIWGLPKADVGTNRARICVLKQCVVSGVSVPCRSGWVDTQRCVAMRSRVCWGWAVAFVSACSRM